MPTVQDFQRDLDALIVSARERHDTAGMLFERVVAAIEAKAASDASFVAAFAHLLPPAVASYQNQNIPSPEDEAMMARLGTLRNAIGARA